MRTMFLITFLMLSGLSWSQTGHGKKVTIHLNNITLEEALTILSISYAIEFSYSDDVVPTHEIVNLSIQDETLTSALDKLLSKFNLGYKVTGKRVLLKKSSRCSWSCRSGSSGCWFLLGREGAGTAHAATRPPRSCGDGHADACGERRLPG